MKKEEVIGRLLSACISADSSPYEYVGGYMQPGDEGTLITNDIAEEVRQQLITNQHQT